MPSQQFQLLVHRQLGYLRTAALYLAALSNVYRMLEVRYGRAVF